MSRSHGSLPNRGGSYVYDVTLDKNVTHHVMKLSDCHPRRQIAFHNHRWNTKFKYSEIQAWHDICLEDVSDDIWNNVFCHYLTCKDIGLRIRHCCKHFYKITNGKNSNSPFNNHYKHKCRPLIDEINDSIYRFKRTEFDILGRSHTPFARYCKKYYEMKIPKPNNYESSNWCGIYHQLTQFIKKNDQLMEKYKIFDEIATSESLLIDVQNRDYRFPQFCLSKYFLSV